MSSRIFSHYSYGLREGDAHNLMLMWHLIQLFCGGASPHHSIPLDKRDGGIHISAQLNCVYCVFSSAFILHEVAFSWFSSYVPTHKRGRLLKRSFDTLKPLKPTKSCFLIWQISTERGCVWLYVCTRQFARSNYFIAKNTESLMYMPMRIWNPRFEK